MAASSNSSDCTVALGTEVDGAESNCDHSKYEILFPLVFDYDGASAAWQAPPQTVAEARFQAVLMET